MTSPTQEVPSPVKSDEPILFLSQVIENVPLERRAVFIAELKKAVRGGNFDGGFVDEEYELRYAGRAKNGSAPEAKTERQHDFAIANTEDFQKWFREQLRPRRRGGMRLHSKEDLASGKISVADLASQYRRRNEARGEGKGRAGGRRGRSRADK